MHRRKEVLPDFIQNRLHVLETANHGEHRILFRQDDAVLAERSVAAIAMVPTAPELITVAGRPIRVCLGIAIIRVRFRGLRDPFLRDDALARALGLVI
jgi:hypothetical protein